MTAYRMPLQAKPQRMSIALAGVTYNLVSRYNQYAAAWVLDLYDASGTALLLGVPIVTGSDLLEQFAYLAIGGELIAQTDHDTDAVPTFTNLGANGNLYFVTP
jgi:hypothetical protein